MKRPGRLDQWGDYWGVTVFCVLLLGLGIPSIDTIAKIPEDNPPALFYQDDPGWPGVWSVYYAKINGAEGQGEGTITIIRNADGSYDTTITGNAFALDLREKKPPYPKRTTKITSAAEQFVFTIQVDQYHYGQLDWGDTVNTHTGSVVIQLQRTEDRDMLSGNFHGTLTHFITGSDEGGWHIKEQSQPLEFTGQLEAERIGAAPAGQAPQPTAESAAPQVIIPPVDEEEAAPPSGQDVFTPPDDSNTSSIPADWDMVSPVGQVAAATATTILLAAWLFMEAQSAAQGSRAPQPPRSSSNNIVDTVVDGVGSMSPTEAGEELAEHTADILDALDGSQPPEKDSDTIFDAVRDGTKSITPQEAGERLAQQTAGLLNQLDKLNKPPVVPQKPPPAGGTQPASSQPTGGAQPTPSTPTTNTTYNGPPGETTIEIFGGEDVHAILQALQIIPRNIPDDGQIQINRANLDHFLSGHPDGTPHWVKLPNGNVIVINTVQGITFEDFQYDASGQSTVDFTRGIAIAAEVIKPPSNTPTPAPAGSAPGQGDSQGDASQQGQQSRDQRDQDGLLGQRPGEQPGDDRQAGETPQDQPSTEPQAETQAASDQTGQPIAGDKAPGGSPGTRGTGEPSYDGLSTSESTGSGTTTAEDPTELDRFIGAKWGRDSQSQGQGWSASEGMGSEDQGFSNGAGTGEAQTGSSGAEALGFDETVDEEAPESGPAGTTNKSFETTRQEILDELMDPSTPPERIEELEKQLDLHERVDNLIDELDSRSTGMEDTPRPPSVPGGEEDGGSHAGLIDGDESKSATEGF